MSAAALRVIDTQPDAMPLALALSPDTRFEDWVAIGRRLCIGSQAVNWHIGDWWAFGDHRYGERAQAAAEGIFGREFQTLRNLATVARTFEPSRRRDALSFTHHAEVAGLAKSDPNLADTLLDRAVSERLSKSDLRHEVQALRVANDAERGEVPTIRATPKPNRTELEEAYSRYVEAMEALEHFRPLTKREQDFFAVSLDALGEAHAERRPPPDDFRIVFVEQGRLACEPWYRASRITVNRWLLQSGKKGLLEERASFVKHQRAQAYPSQVKPTIPVPAGVDVLQPIARMAADFLRQSRHGGWFISKVQDAHGWLVGTVRRTSEELIAMAERQGFDRARAEAEAGEPN